MRAVVVWLAAASCGRVDFDVRSDATRDAAIGPPCNAVTRFADDFADGLRDPRWGASFMGTGTITAEVGGELVMTLATNTAGAYAGYNTIRYYDLHGVRMSVAVTQVPAPAATVGFGATYDTSDGTGIRITLKNDTLVAVRSIGATYDQIATLPYDPVAQRYWAIEEHAGRIAYEVSSDGVVYTTFAEIDDPFDVSLLQINLFAGTDTAVAAPGTAHFAAFDGGAPAPIDACATASLVDRFDGSVSDRLWLSSFVDACCAQTEPGGVLELATDGTVGFLAKSSSAGYDLRNGAIEVTITTLPATTTFGVSLDASRDANNQLAVAIQDNTVTALVIVSGAGTPITSPLNPGERYLRIRESAGTVTFEISVDNQAWRMLRQLPDPFLVDDVMIGIDGGANSPGSADTVTLDDFDVP